METVEICCDASIKTYSNGRTFGCSGAIVIGPDMEQFKIVPDCTNNRAELIALYIAVRMAHEIKKRKSCNVIIYADSKFAVYGIKVWMKNWLDNMDNNRILYNYEGQPVKNQELFKMIISYIVSNKLTIYLRHQKGHVKLTETKLATANRVFYESNGYYLNYNDIYRISKYNSIIDQHTRDKLQDINPDDYPIIYDDPNLLNLCNYIIDPNYMDYIL